MTFEKAKEILDEERCFSYIKRMGEDERRVVKVNDWEKLRVREAIIKLGELGYEVYYTLSPVEVEYRKEFLERGNKKCETPAISGKSFSIPEELKKLAKSAKLFNDALLDEQAKKIKEQKKLIDSLQSKLAEADGNYKFAMEKLKKIESQKKEIKHLNKLLASRNKEIWDLKERLKGMKNLSKEIDRLHTIIRVKEDLLNKYRINDCNKDEMIAALRKEVAEAKGEKPYPTEDDPEEVSLSDMVKTVIDAFFDGKSVYIK